MPARGAVRMNRYCVCWTAADCRPRQKTRIAGPGCACYGDGTEMQCDTCL